MRKKSLSLSKKSPVLARGPPEGEAQVQLEECGPEHLDAEGV